VGGTGALREIKRFGLRLIIIYLLQAQPGAQTREVARIGRI